MNTYSSGMDLSIPPTPLPGGLPPGSARGGRTIFRPKCLPKPLRNELLTSIATFLAFEAVSKPKFANFHPPRPSKSSIFIEKVIIL